MVGASNAFNQVIEKDLDALMDRTKTVQFLRKNVYFSALVVASVLTIVGITLLYMINPKTAMFAFVIFLYTSVYTPLKRSHHYPFLWVLFRELFRLC
jgi:protoheme IX farnesyltransferase